MVRIHARQPVGYPLITTITSEAGYFCLPLACHVCGERVAVRRISPQGKALPRKRTGAAEASRDHQKKSSTRAAILSATKRDPRVPPSAATVRICSAWAFIRSHVDVDFFAAIRDFDAALRPGDANQVNEMVRYRANSNIANGEFREATLEYKFLRDGSQRRVLDEMVKKGLAGVEDYKNPKGGRSTRRYFSITARHRERRGDAQFNRRR